MVSISILNLTISSMVQFFYQFQPQKESVNLSLGDRINVNVH
jgi:hypothetical protein